MTSIIMSTATRFLLPLLLLFSIFLMLRGHNEPGGGFVGGLVAAASFSLYALTYGVEDARKVLLIDPRTLLALGLLVSVAAGILPLLFEKPFFQGLWVERSFPVLGNIGLGSPLIFDLGVYLVVTGTTLTILLPLAEE